VAKPNHALKKGQKVEIAFQSLSYGGEAVSKDMGIPIFVNRACPGDFAEVELFDVRKNFAKGRLTKIIKASAQRREPPCPIFKVCGGCQWQHLTYEAQLEAKRDVVRQAIEHIGGLAGGLVQPAIASPIELNYRNKVQFPVKQAHGSDRILAGYYQQDSHDLVNIKHCPIQPEPLDRMLSAVKDACTAHRIWAYDERTGKGLLRHINARMSFASGDVLVTLVVNSTEEDLPKRIRQSLEEIAQEITEKVPEIKGVCLNFNTATGNKIYGDRTVNIAGVSHIEEILSAGAKELKFRLSPTSFFQVNSPQASTLMQCVYDAIEEHQQSKSKSKLIVDAYAGVGAIAFFVADLAEKVLAVEEFAPAVEDGLVNLNLNAETNDLSNVEFRLGSTESVLAEMGDKGVSPDVVVVDPPRKGMSPEALDAVAKLAPALIVYVSCNPSTLARDLKALTERAILPQAEKGLVYGYKTKKIQPVDLFPQTYHNESVTNIELKTRPE